jgi:hypothetical protein
MRPSWRCEKAVDKRWMSGGKEILSLPDAQTAN